MADKQIQLEKTVAGKKQAPVQNTRPQPDLNGKPQGTNTTQPDSKSNPKAKQSNKGAPTSGSADAVSREVLLILKELNDKLKTQEEKLEKQDARLETLFSTADEYEYNEYDEQYNEEQYEDDGSFSQSQNDFPNTSQGTASSSVFKNLAGKFQQTEPVDNEVNDDLAVFVNGSFRNGINDEKHLELLKSITRPVNCVSLVKTRVNQGIWRLLKANTQADDNRMQGIQATIVKAACNVVKLMDKCGEKFDTEEMEWGSDAVALLGQANKMINVRRKDQHKSDLDPKYHYLASSSLPFTEYLYGEDVDFNKNVREINDMSRVGRNIRGGGYPSQRGFRGRRFFPYARRGFFRGRGIQRRFDPAAKNLKMAPKK